MSIQAWVAAPPKQCCLSLYNSNNQTLICTKLQRVPVNLKKQSSGVIGSRIRVRVRAGGEGDLPAQRPVARPVSEDKPFQTVLVEDDGVSVEGVIKLDKQEAPRRPWKRVAVLVGGDVLALLIFAAIGRLSHGMPVLDWETFHTADPFIAGWLLGAYFLGGYESEGLGVNGVVKAVFVATKSWAVGIPIGLAIRGVAASHFPAPAFILVSMGSTIVLLVGWRAVFTSLFPNDEQNRKKRESYKQGSPLEFFQLLISLVRRW